LEKKGHEFLQPDYEDFRILRSVGVKSEQEGLCRIRPFDL